jgi:hypothetical protein
MHPPRLARQLAIDRRSPMIRSLSGDFQSRSTIILAASGRASERAACDIRRRRSPSAASARIRSARTAPVMSFCSSISAAPASAIASAFLRW